MVLALDTLSLGIQLSTKESEYKTKYQGDMMEQGRQQLLTVCLEPWVSVRHDTGVQCPV